MFRTPVLAAALAVLAVPAAAADIKVSVLGLDAASAHTQIVRAARTACSVALRGSFLEAHYEMESCIDDAVASAEAKLILGHAVAKMR
jgi:hypothetical protein